MLSGSVASRSGPEVDRGSENDRLISRGDHLLDGLPISDIALDRRQLKRVTAKVLRRSMRQTHAVEQRHRMTARQERDSDIETNEAIATENKNSHVSTPTGSRQNCALMTHKASVLGAHLRRCVE